MTLYAKPLLQGSQPYRTAIQHFVTYNLHTKKLKTLQSVAIYKQDNHVDSRFSRCASAVASSSTL